MTLLSSVMSASEEIQPNETSTTPRSLPNGRRRTTRLPRVQEVQEITLLEADSKRREDAKGGRRIVREVTVDDWKFLLAHQLRSEGQRRAPRETGGRRRATTEHGRLLRDPTGVFPF